MTNVGVEQAAIKIRRHVQVVVLRKGSPGQEIRDFGVAELNFSRLLFSDDVFGLKRTFSCFAQLNQFVRNELIQWRLKYNNGLINQVLPDKPLQALSPCIYNQQKLYFRICR